MEKDNGKVSFSYLGNEIIVKNFSHPTQGIASLYGENFGAFSFDELDKYAYKEAKKSSQNIIYIAIQFVEKDDYGNTSLGKKITIGSIDVNDSKLFADFNSWKRKYGTYKMWNKDREEYDKKYMRNNQNGFRIIRIIPAYEPKSIR
jgi:hypothetical protein